MAPLRRTTVLALAGYCANVTAMTPSHGCSSGGPLPAVRGKHRVVRREIAVQDFEDVRRRYFIELPLGLTWHEMQQNPSPLLLAFHGQTGEARSFGNSHNFTLVGKAMGENLVAVFPQGMDDAPPHKPKRDQGTGWNVGSGGDIGNATCIPQGVGAGGACYVSCRKLKKCGRCNWSTCYDDVLFVKQVIQAVGQELCINLDRVYAQGESNGAMFVQHLVRELPNAFAGVTTWFGTPMLGFLLGSSAQLIADKPLLQRTAILALHGRQDVTIPPTGGVSDGGWLFEPLDQAMAIWALMHSCSRQRTTLQTRWDGGQLGFACTQYPHCGTGRKVVQCMYDGVHGDWPTGDHGDEITLWFLLQFSRRKPPLPEGEHEWQPAVVV